MRRDRIRAIGIDDDGRLWVQPATETFSLIYREAWRSIGIPVEAVSLRPIERAGRPCVGLFRSSLQRERPTVIFSSTTKPGGKAWARICAMTFQRHKIGSMRTKL